jgi:NMT1-like family
MVFYWRAPTVLSVAVGPSTGEDFKYMTAVAQAFARERSSLRLKLVSVDSPERAAELPRIGLGVAVLHRNAAVFVVPDKSNIGSVGDLKGVSIGVIRPLSANTALLEKILAHYDIRASQVQILPLSATDTVPALRDGRVKALFVVGSLRGNALSEAMRSLTTALHVPPVLLPVLETEAIAQRNPALEAFEIPRGAFGGAPPLPNETLMTPAISHRLMAASALDNDTVGALTQALFEAQPTVERDPANAMLIKLEAPDTEKDATLPVHPGAGAYFDGEQTTFFDRYGDWFYIGAMLLSLIGSSIAALITLFAKQERIESHTIVEQMLFVLENVKTALPHETPHLLEQADALLHTLFRLSVSGKADALKMQTATLVMKEIRYQLSVRGSTPTEQQNDTDHGQETRKNPQASPEPAFQRSEQAA